MGAEKARLSIRPALVVSALLVSLAGAGTLAQAGFPYDVPDKFKFQIGGISAQLTTQGAVGRTDGAVGAFVSLEDTFDLPIRKSTWDAQGYWRFSEKGYVDFGYFSLQREAAHIIEQDVSWGDFIFLADGEVRAKFDSSFGYAAYRHDFLHLEQVRISGSAGFSYLQIKAGLSAEGSVTDQDGNPVSGEVSEEGKVNFPVPLLGLQLDWALTKHTAIMMYTRHLYINVGDFRGGVSQSAVFYEWYAARHFGLGGGISNYRINIKNYTSGDKTAKFNYDVSGVELYFKFPF